MYLVLFRFCGSSWRHAMKSSRSPTHAESGEAERVLRIPFVFCSLSTCYTSCRTRQRHGFCKISDVWPIVRLPRIPSLTRQLLVSSCPKESRQLWCRSTDPLCAHALHQSTTKLDLFRLEPVKVFSFASARSSHVREVRFLVPHGTLNRRFRRQPCPYRRCPTGEARITPGFRLDAKFVVRRDVVVSRN